MGHYFLKCVCILEVGVTSVVDFQTLSKAYRIRISRSRAGESVF